MREGTHLRAEDFMCRPATYMSSGGVWLTRISVLFDKVVYRLKLLLHIMQIIKSWL